MVILNFIEIHNFAEVNSVTEILGWIFFCGIKYMFAVPTMIATSHREWYWDMLIAAAGGSWSIFVFTYLGAYISQFLGKYHLFKLRFKRLKKIISIKNSYGMWGLAILSPVVFSIPIGCIISSSIEHDKKKIIRYQITSVVLWSILLFGLKGLFGIKVDKLY